MIENVVRKEKMSAALSASSSSSMSLISEKKKECKITMECFNETSCTSAKCIRNEDLCSAGNEEDKIISADKGFAQEEEKHDSEEKMKTREIHMYH